MIFIGYSLRSLIITKAIVEIVASAHANHVSNIPYIRPPHRRPDNSALETILGVNDVSKDTVIEFGEPSQTLEQLNESSRRL